MLHPSRADWRDKGESLRPIRIKCGSAADAVRVASLRSRPYAFSMFYQRAESPLRLNGLDAARRFFANCLAETDPNKEHLWVAHVDEQARCIHLSRHDGDVGAANLPLRDVITDAATHGSAGLILAHNHPGGDPTPSADDRHLTRRLALAAEAIDLTLLDHLVIAGPECRSMRQMGLL